METSGPTPGSTPVTGTNAAATAVRWQVGQLLQATVAESLAGKILLSIGNRQVISDASLPLEKGQQLTVQVRSLGDVPVLRITSTPVSTPLAQAIRALIPQQGSMTPLLASLSRLAHTAQPPVPPLIRELTRSLVRNLPDTTAVTRPDTLRTAIERSGLLLERHLAQLANRPHAQVQGHVPVAPIEKDFKANLLQLIGRLRNWPGSPVEPRVPSTAKTPAPPTPAGAPAATARSPLRGAAPGALADTVRGNSSTGNPAPAAGGSNPANPAPSAPTISADQLHRALQSGVRAPLADARLISTNIPLPPATPGAAAGTGTGALPAALQGSVPPPFPGSVPVPQAAVQATIDLINRIGNLRTDLLRQTETALARIQLHQLASQPREAERGLLEWLFELPVRRGDDIDLWSIRFAREQTDSHAKKRRAQHSWSVQLAFDLPGLGPVQAQISLRGERVSTRFWAGQEQVLPLFRDNLQALQKMFGDAGLEVGELDCVPGPMPSGAAAPALIREKV